MSSFNPAIGGKSHKRNFTHVEPKGHYAPKDSWWVQATDADFMIRRDAELPRLMRAPITHTTAESGNSSRQAFMARKVASMFDRVRGGSE